LLKNHIKFQFLSSCPVCKKRYDVYWKIINHLKKSKDNDHSLFLQEEEKQLIDLYVNNNDSRKNIHEMLYKSNNIFCGISYEKIMLTISKYISKEDLEENRKNRISLSMKKVVKTEIHNKNVSIGVKKAWNEGKFSTEEYRDLYDKGIEKRRSFKGRNNPMYGVSCPVKAGRGKGGKRKDLGHYVRSTWEANICRIYKMKNIKYYYEYKRFSISIKENDYTYCPDLYLPHKNMYYEIKGHAKSSFEWNCNCEVCIKNKKIIPQVVKKYKIKLIIIGGSEYKRMKRIFKRFIPEWEK